jgi:SAM-dependent methyltransferase
VTRVAGVPDLTERRLAVELMDSPGLDRERHLEALDALARVNAVSLSAGRLWSEIARLGRAGVRPVRVLDVACGGGDMLAALARRSRRRGVDVELHGCDLNPVALERARAGAGGRLGVTFQTLDVVDDPLPTGFDVVCTSLFLHHLEHRNAVRLLGAMARAARRLVFVQDLRRTRLGHVFARVGLQVLTRSDVARHDGLVSVEAAFTTEEAEALCREAGLAGARVSTCWPQRLTIRWVPT